MNIYVIGYPKSGTIWLSRLVGDALNSPVRSYDNKPSLADEGYERTGKYIIRHRHSTPDKVHPKAKTLFITRDPRDLIVSRAHYWGRSIDRSMKEVCNQWPKFMNAWLPQTRPNTYPTRYEWLAKDTQNELFYLLDSIGVTPIRILADVVRRQSLKSRIKLLESGKKLPYDTPTQRRLLNKGIVGNWKEHLTAEHLAYIYKHIGDLMEKLEYER